MQRKVLVTLTAVTAGLVDARRAGGGRPAYDRFVVYPVRSWAGSVAVADVNGDRRDDVIVSTSYSGNAANDFKIVLFTQDAAGTFGAHPLRHHRAGRRPHGTGRRRPQRRRVRRRGPGTSSGIVIRHGGSSGLAPPMFVATTPAHHVEVAQRVGQPGRRVLVAGPPVSPWVTSTATAWATSSSPIPSTASSSSAPTSPPRHRSAGDGDPQRALGAGQGQLGHVHLRVRRARGTFQCSLSGAPPATCTSPQAYSNLADGASDFTVGAVDVAGNADPSPAVRSVKAKGDLTYTAWNASVSTTVR